MAYKLSQYLRLQRYALLRLCSALVFFVSVFSGSIYAQNELYRISKAERSDGLGYVVRFHYSSRIDSFNVIHPAPDLIQMEMFASDIDTNGIQMPPETGKIKEIRLYKMEGKYGVDIYLDQDVYVKSQSYFDQNGKDILLALGKSDKEEVEAYTQQFIAKNWYLEINPEEGLRVNSLPNAAQVDDSYNIVRDKLKFDTIVIDAGHGGRDPGTIGYKGAKEKDVTLAIALKLGSYIEEYLPDVKVIYTRKEDLNILPNADNLEELKERGRIANREEADLFISIHADGFKNSSVRGSSVFFLGLNRSNTSLNVIKEESHLFNMNEVIEDFSEEDLLIYELANSGKISTSEKIAYMIEDQLKNRAQRKSRGVRQMGLVVLYQATMPGILVETGFLTNPSEQRYLTSEHGQSIIASAIFRAIRDYKVEYEKTQAYSTGGSK